MHICSTDLITSRVRFNCFNLFFQNLKQNKTNLIPSCAELKDIIIAVSHDVFKKKQANEPTHQDKTQWYPRCIGISEGDSGKRGDDSTNMAAGILFTT